MSALFLILLCCLAPSLRAASGNITYTLVREASPTPDQQDAYSRIERAMDSALYYYNTYTSLRKRLTVYYNTGVPTAQANFDGVISFGANRSYMTVITAMHEIAHTIGIGTTNEYRSLIVNGVFTGPLATAELRAIQGDPQAQLKGDAQHFWPYGLNYASEVSSTQDLIHHCKIVNAIFRDMFQETLFFTGIVRNRSTGQCMSRNGNNLILASCSDSNALVSIIAMGSPVSNYRMEFGDLVLDVPNESTAEGVFLSLYTWNGKNHQRFTLIHQIRDTDTLYHLRMVNSGLYLRANGNRVQQVTTNTSPESQLWELLPHLQIPVFISSGSHTRLNRSAEYHRKRDLLGRARDHQRRITP